MFHFEVYSLPWQVRTDKTERPGLGKTEATLERFSEGVTFKGALASIEGNWGPVGFALIAFRLPEGLPPFSSIHITAKQSCDDSLIAATPSKALALCRFACLIKDNQSQQPSGTLTFQHSFQPETETKTFKLPLESFHGKIRGRNVQNASLAPSSIHEIAIQIARSEQSHELVPIAPLPFSISLLELRLE